MVTYFPSLQCPETTDCSLLARFGVEVQVSNSAVTRTPCLTQGGSTEHVTKDALNLPGD